MQDIVPEPANSGLAPASTPRPGAIQAFRALAALEGYETRLECWRAAPQVAEVADLHAQLVRLRRCCGGCAALTVPWLSLMLSHFELLAVAREPAPDPERLALTTARHALAVRQLAAACRRPLLHQEQAPAPGSRARERRAMRDHDGEAATARP